MARNTITIHTDIPVSSCSGSGPTYTANYASYNLLTIGIQIGDWITAVHREAGDDGGDILSTYTYQVVGITDSDTLTIKYITDDMELGDASPCDLNSGEGSSGSPTNSPHTFTRDLGPAFGLFVGPE
jgi:hypothetical protein